MVSMTETKLIAQVCDDRLLVLIPDQLEDVANFARQVYWLAVGQQRDVAYLTINNRESDALANTRLLATLEALTLSQSLKVHSLQIDADHWSDALHMVARPGDIVISPDPQALVAGNEKSEEVISALESELGVQLQFLPEVYTSEKYAPVWVRPLISWVTGLAILVGFSFLEFRLAGAISGGLKKTVLILLVMLEFGILYAWNKVFA